MNNLIAVNLQADIPQQYLNTPIADLFEYHNMSKPIDVAYERAELLVGMCMDNRKRLIIPNNFAFIIRAGGANLRYSAFKVSYAIAVGKIKHIAIIAHNNCGMVNVSERKEIFVNGLVEIAGWQKDKAYEHFDEFAHKFEIGNEISFIKNEAIRLRLRYPKVMVAPLYYNVDDNKLYLVREDKNKFLEELSE